MTVEKIGRFSKESPKSAEKKIRKPKQQKTPTKHQIRLNINNIESIPSNKDEAKAEYFDRLAWTAPLLLQFFTILLQLTTQLTQGSFWRKFTIAPPSFLIESPFSFPAHSKSNNKVRDQA